MKTRKLTTIKRSRSSSSRSGSSSLSRKRGKNISSSGSTIPSEEFSSDIFEEPNLLGQGTYGAVYKHPRNSNYVYKKYKGSPTRVEREMKTELKNSKRVKKHIGESAQEIFSLIQSKSKKQKSVKFLRLSQTLHSVLHPKQGPFPLSLEGSKKLKNKTFELAEKFNSYGLYHNDLHVSNVMVTYKDPKSEPILSLIDLGRVSPKRTNYSTGAHFLDNEDADKYYLTRDFAYYDKKLFNVYGKLIAEYLNGQDISDDITRENEFFGTEIDYIGRRTHIPIERLQEDERVIRQLTNHIINTRAVGVAEFSLGDFDWPQHNGWSVFPGTPSETKRFFGTY